MRAFVAVRQALPVLATQKDIEELRQRYVPVRSRSQIVTLNRDQV